MKDQIIFISYSVIIITGVISLLMAKYLPDKLIFPDEQQFIVYDKNKFKALKRHQFYILGLYFITIGLAFMTIIGNPLFTFVLTFIVPILFITKMESQLKKLYRKF